MGIYLGLDSSTQSLKAMIADSSSGKILYSESLNFGADLPLFRCPSGFLENPDPLVRHSDPMMWLAAMDLLFSRMKQKNAPLSLVEGISGSGQQHGSVFLNSSFTDKLKNLDPSKELIPQLESTLAMKTSPIWMDSSTGEEVREISERFGSRLQSDTGSPAIERFTGPQIRKVWKKSPEIYANTSVIHLVSSFLASVLCGENSPIDFGDGAGMNLLNLKTLSWDKDIVEFTAPGLLNKLPPVKKSSSIAGKLHSYFTKYGLKEGIPVNLWSGDNPCSLIGTGASKPGTAVISLGTSDTFFAAMSRPVTDPDGCGHVFGNPADGFMSLICFKNGSLAREKVRERFALDFKTFDNIAYAIPAGNNGNLMLPYYIPEITPLVMQEGVRMSGALNFVSGDADPAAYVRAIMEAQAMSMKIHSAWLGEDFKRIRVTGGASKSRILCEIIANVFQADVEKISVPDSAALGAAMRAANACGGVAWSELEEKFTKASEIIHPDTYVASVYKNMIEQYIKFENTITK